ncbi:hypothetical protein Tco_1455230 [Tanacetum coccineum]
MFLSRRRHPLALRLHRNTKMKAHPKHIDWGKLTVTQEIMNGEEEEANVAKASEDMKLYIMKEKFLVMIESEKAIVKDYTKLVVTNRMVDYVLEIYGNTWKYDKGKGAEYHHLKGKRKVHDFQNILGSLEVDLARAIKAKQVDDHNDDDLDSLDLANIIKKLEEDFGRLLKAKNAKEVKEAKKASEAKKAKEAKKARDVELKAKKAKEAELKAKKAKKAMQAELKAKKAKEAMLAEVV